MLAFSIGNNTGECGLELILVSTLHLKNSLWHKTDPVRPLVHAQVHQFMSSLTATRTGSDMTFLEPPLEDHII